MNTLLRSAAIIILCMQPISGLFCADQSTQKAHARIHSLLHHIDPNTQFLQEKETDPSNLRGHRWKRLEGKSRSEKEYKSNPSQSAQYRTVIPDEKIKQALGIDLSSHPDLLEKIQEEERRHPDKFAFYHGSELTFFVLQDLAQLLYRISHNIPENLDWFPLRSMEEYFSEDITLEDYLKQNINLNDRETPYRNHLLSTNLSIPGHLAPSESSLYHFSGSYSQMFDLSKMNAVLEALINDLSIGNELSPVEKKLIILQLRHLTNKLQETSDTGGLLQILIDKAIVDEAVYLCYSLGRPHMTKFIRTGWDENLGCYTRIRPTLEALLNTPQQLNEAKKIDQLQARILLRKKYFAQPNRHVMIKKYHTIPNDALHAYKKEILSLSYFICSHSLADRGVSTLPAATNAATKGISHTDSGICFSAIELFCELVRANYDPALPAATNAATKGISHTDSGICFSAIELFCELVRANYDPALPAATNASLKGICGTNSEVCSLALQLFSELFKANYEPAFQVAISTASWALHEADRRVSPADLNLFIELVKAKYEPAFQAATKVASKGLLNAADDIVRNLARKLFFELFKAKYEPALPAAISAAIEGTKAPNGNVRSSAFILFSELVEANYESAFEAATNAASMRVIDVYVRCCALGLFSKLVKANYEPVLPVASSAATKGINDVSSSARRAALILFAELVKANYTHAFEAATDAAIKGVNDKKAISDPFSLVRRNALILFADLAKANYTRAFSGATKAASKGIGDAVEQVRHYALELFSELVKTNFEPALQSATKAVAKGMSDTDSDVRRSARELKALIETKHGTRSRL